MTQTRGAAYGWHALTFVVAAFALALQTYLVIAGQNVIDDNVVLAPLAERVRRLFSYFTIQSNLLVAVSVWTIIRGHTESRLFHVLRLASTIGITVTGVVAAVALPPSATYSTANLVCDRLLHIVVPLLAVIGWVAFGPRGKVDRDDVFLSLVWPILWLVATLALGPIAHWYPYPFINVDQIGYGSTLLNCLVIAVLFLALAALLWWADRRLPGGRSPRTVSTRSGRR